MYNGKKGEIGEIVMADKNIQDQSGRKTPKADREQGSQYYEHFEHSERGTQKKTTMSQTVSSPPTPKE